MVILPLVGGLIAFVTVLLGNLMAGIGLSSFDITLPSFLADLFGTGV